MSTVLTQTGNLALPGGFRREELYETVRGKRVEAPLMGAQESGIANLLGRYIWLFWGDSPQGIVAIEVLFRLDSAGDVELRPDAAVVSFERWPQRVIPPGNAWAVVPNLAVEVISPTNFALDVQTKIEDYFTHGVNLVWVIYPPHRKIYVYEGVKKVQILDSNDTLDGGTVLPGFKLAVSKLFEVLPQQP